MTVLENVLVTPTGYHEWQGALSSSGYGNINVNGKTWKAHRYAWTLANGQIPDGKWVLHKCDNPPCCNPEHLFIGTRLDNVRDMHAKGRARKAFGCTHPHAALIESDVVRIREAHKFGARQVDLAAVFGIGQTAVSAITRRQWWRHVE